MERRTATIPVEREPRGRVPARSAGNVYLRSIAEHFEVFVRERAEAWLPRLHDERELPYPKVIIQDALRAALAAAQDGAELARWGACLGELEHYLPDWELEPYWAALEHERECIRLMGRANIEHRLDRPTGLTPEELASYERHVAGAAGLRPLLDKVTAAVARGRARLQH
jgi:hypothetical protein